MQETKAQDNTIRVYAVGGGGTNLGLRLEEFTREAPGFSKLDICYADTSESNLIGLKDQGPIQRFHRIVGLDDSKPIDGSGGKRDTNIDELVQSSREILQKFKPGRWNIILGSIAGGTGSVLGPLLARELMERNESVIIVGIGSQATGNETRNTRGAIRSYANMAQTAEQPLVMAYYENERVEDRPRNDDAVEIVVCAVSALLSGQNRELDSEDLRNFLRFDRVTPHSGVQLARLQLVRGDDSAIGSGEALLAVATLARSPEKSGFAHRVEARPIGYYQNNGMDERLGEAPFHFVLTDGFFDRVLTRLDAVDAEFEKAKQAARRGSDLTAGGKKTSTGIVL